MIKKPVLALVVPCFNEEEILEDTYSKLIEKMYSLKKENLIASSSYILFVDDGSLDNTWNIIKSFENHTKALKLSKNQGHQYALLAGINFLENKCDCLISLDADLQDDINLLDKMIKEFLDGNQIVYAARSNREIDKPSKRISAELYYKFMNKIGVKLIYNHADYRLMSNKAIKFFNTFKEINLFIRGLVPLIGLKSTTIYYTRQKRLAGETKYPLRKMLSFAYNGLTSFSTFPLRIISITGFLVFILSIIMGLYTFYIVLFTNSAVPGWASTVLPIYFIGGIQLLSIGILGEYIGKMYIETKNRPRYFIEEIIE